MREMLYLFVFTQFRTQNRCSLLLELLKITPGVNPGGHVSGCPRLSNGDFSEVQIETRAHRRGEC